MGKSGSTHTHTRQRSRKPNLWTLHKDGESEITGRKGEARMKEGGRGREREMSKIIIERWRKKISGAADRSYCSQEKKLFQGKRCQERDRNK